MQYIKAFIGGFVATLVFHQGVYALFYAAGKVPAPPFNMTATDPLGIPSVISLAFWGGIWGMGIWWIIRNSRGFPHLIQAALFGALGPSAVAMLIVFPMKDLPVDAQTWVGALILNAAWGIGLALFMKLFHKSRQHGSF